MPLISPDRCTDTIAVAPAAAACSYTSRTASGAGRDVDTGRNSRSASATSAGVAPSAPSSYDVAPITTWSGTTRIPRACVTSAGSEAVESVTITVPDMGPQATRPVWPPRLR